MTAIRFAPPVPPIRPLLTRPEDRESFRIMAHDARERLARDEAEELRKARGRRQ
jgi:hypothetical protein